MSVLISVWYQTDAPNTKTWTLKKKITHAYYAPLLKCIELAPTSSNITPEHTELQKQVSCTCNGFFASISTCVCRILESRPLSRPPFVLSPCLHQTDGAYQLP
jgi:hypothetical protein